MRCNISLSTPTFQSVESTLMVCFPPPPPPFRKQGPQQCAIHHLPLFNHIRRLPLSVLLCIEKHVQPCAARRGLYRVMLGYSGLYRVTLGHRSCYSVSAKCNQWRGVDLMPVCAILCVCFPCYASPPRFPPSAPARPVYGFVCV